MCFLMKGRITTSGGDVAKISHLNLIKLLNSTTSAHKTRGLDKYAKRHHEDSISETQTEKR